MLKTSPNSTPMGRWSLLVASGLAILAGGVAWAGQPDHPELRVVEPATHSARLTLTYGAETVHPELHFRNDARISADMGEGDTAITLDITLDRVGDRFNLTSSVERGGRSLATQDFEFAQDTPFNRTLTIGGQSAPLVIDGIVTALSKTDEKAGGPGEIAAGPADPMPLQQPPPHYPAEAEAAGSTGKVIVKVSIGANGEVTAAEVQDSSGHLSLDEAARTAVLEWSFAPARRDGVPVPAEVVVPICFSLDPDGETGCEARERPSA